jgi:hypothetical protein
MRRHTLLATLAALAAVALLAAGCGGTDAASTPDEPDPDEPVTSPDDGTTDDPVDDPDGVGDDCPTDEAREEARGLLGMNEDDLPDDVRTARRGDETFALTEDYVLGRRTVELDDEGDGYRVTAVTVELPDGPETFELEPS